MTSPRELDPRDDRSHEHGGEDGWRESLTFVLADPSIAIVVRGSWDPQSRRASGDVLMRLEDGVLVRAAFREEGVKTRETSIGDLRFECVERLATWSVAAGTLALTGVADTAVVGGGTAGTTSVPSMGQARRLEFELAIEAVGVADGEATRRQVITDQRFASIVSSGHFNQPIRGTGRISLGQRQLRVEMLGVRSRTWGVREPDPSDARLLVAFDETHAVWHERLVLSDATIARTGSLGEGTLPDTLAVKRHDEGAVSKVLLGGLAAEPLVALPADRDDPYERILARVHHGDREALGYLELAANDGALTP